MTYQKQKKIIRFILIIITVLYAGFFFYGTIFSRTPGIKYIFKSEPFWSYKEWFSDASTGIEKQITENLIVLIPFGFLLTSLLSETRLKEWKKFLIVAGFSLGLSLIAETSQLIFRLGTCELDDLFNNTISGSIGYGCYRLFRLILDALKNKWKGKTPAKGIISGWLSVLIGLVCLLTGPIIADIRTEEDIGVKDFIFQLDSVKIQNGNLVLNGFTFIPEQDSAFYEFSKPTVLIKSTEETELKALNTDYGQDRQDVNNYFLCEYDYSKSGFMAVVPISEMDINQEYEVLVRFGYIGSVSTNTFITGTNIHYASDCDYVAPKTEGTDLDVIVKDGKLRVYRPDQFCWIYQYEGRLYWIAEEGFQFDKTGLTNLPLHKSGFTHIPYHLYTTQGANLPEETGNGIFDNNDGFFEEYEITKDINCGSYRVMTRELPTDYSVTYIKTGLYINFNWVWDQDFWPYYDLMS